MKNFVIFLLSVLFCSVPAWADMKVTGVVVGQDDDEPLIGATIMPLPKGTANGTATDMHGAFTLTVPDNCQQVQVSFIGYKTTTVKIDTSKPMHIVLSGDENRLDEVIAVAYGTAKRSEYTGSASVVKADQIADVLTSSVTSALSGRVAGVTVQSDDGRPGSSPKLRIRGVGSINGLSNPLIVVDGVPFEGAISDISPADTESMTVLKDAASTSLYGARGANGVVLITTKRGASGNARITFDANWGGNSRAIPNYNVLSSTNQYMELLYEGMYNQNLANTKDPIASWQKAATDVVKATGYQIYTIPEGEYLVGRNGKINPNAALGYSDGTYFYTPDDWTANSLTSGVRQNYNFSVAGGTDRIKYYASANYLGDEGIIRNSDFKRLSTRATVDYQAKSWLKVGTNLNYANVNSNRPGEMDLDASTSSANAFYIANQIAPVYPMFVRSADGSIKYDQITGYPIYDYGDGVSTNSTRTFMSMANPIGSLYYDTTQYLIDNFDGKWYATISPIEGLNITGNAGYWVSVDRIHDVGNPFYGQSATSGGSAQQYFRHISSINLQGLANYTRTIADDHNIDLMAGYENYHLENEVLYGYGYNLYNPNGWNVTNAIDRIMARGYRSIDYTTRGILARAKYNYAHKYFGHVSYRRDASSRFAPEHRWGNFFSVSGAWDITREDFMEPYRDIFDQLKFKASFGQNGNDALGEDDYYYYAYLDQYQASGANGVWNDATLVFKGNRDITWETSNNLNLGFEFSFLQNTLSGSIEYYQRQVSDMLFNLPAAPSLGYQSFPVNVGSMRNNGIELELNYNIFNSKDFSWSVNANITTMANKIVSLPKELVKGGAWINASRIYREGESMYQFYLPHYAGVNPQTGEAMYSVKFTDEYYNANNLAQKGIPQEFNSGMEYKDKDGNVVIPADYASWADAYNGNEAKGLAENRKESGNLMPKIYGGFGTSLYAYGFDLSMTFAYQAGGKIYDNTYAALMHNATAGNNGKNWHTDMLNRWTTPGQVTDVPRINAADQYSASSSDRFYVSSNFLNFSNITMGYTLPAKLTKVVGLESVRFYASAENVALWSMRRGLDPRQSFATSNSSTYSPIRTISGGVRVQF